VSVCFESLLFYADVEVLPNAEDRFDLGLDLGVGADEDDDDDADVPVQPMTRPIPNRILPEQGVRDRDRVR
jgi:hypothetical protein